MEVPETKTRETQAAIAPAAIASAMRTVWEHGPGDSLKEGLTLMFKREAQESEQPLFRSALIPLLPWNMTDY